MSAEPILGIEIGGTKLQLGVGAGDGSPLLALDRFSVDAARGAEGILQQVARSGSGLVERFRPVAVGIGFGGPIDAAKGQVVKSHHVEGWSEFPLVDWCWRQWGLATALANDADVAGLAEACFGAGRGANPVLYLTVGTGIGGGLIVGGKIYHGCGAGAAEIGHLRPGLDCTSAEANLESLAAGWGIAARAREAFEHAGDDSLGPPAELTAQWVARAAAAGHSRAAEVWNRAVAALGWGIAQAVTVTGPEIVVVGGGVSLAGEELFFRPLRAAVAQYVFPPFRPRLRLVPAALGEEVVIHGALALGSRLAES